jgi:multidrug efflux pump subunit AcrB
MPRSTEHSYLERLKFDPKLLLSPVAKYISNIRLVILLVLSICLLGGFSYFNLPKRLNPEVDISIVTVVTILPGASPEDVEALITIPLENELKGAEGLDQITSVSNENVSAITLQYLSSVSRDKAKDTTQNLVDNVRDLPEDAQDPTVTALDFEDQPIWTFAVTSEGDIPSLMAFSQDLKQKLEDLPKVDRVQISGFEDQEVVVTLKPEKIQQYGLNPLLIAQAIQKGVSSYPAGTVTTQRNVFALTINPSITSLDDLRRIQIMVNGEVVNLGDIAQIEKKSKIDQAVSFLASPETNPERAVTFYVYKTSSVSIDEAGKEVEAAVEAELEKYGSRFKIETLSNTSEEITTQFTDLLGEFRTTILLVFASLLIFLGLRQAVISSFTVPLTFLSAFIFMRVFGMSINFLSLFAFLLALGLLVDDTIVVVSAMTSYHRSGKFTPLQTGLLVWRDTIVPIWSTTITTIWSFVPLLLSSGIIGEFIKPIPIVVTVTMLSSTAIAVLVTLPIMILILKPNIPGRVTLLGKIVLLLASIAALLAVTAGNPLLPIVGILYIVLLVVLYQIFPVLRQKISRLLSHRRVKPVLKKVSSISDKGLIDIEGFSQKYYRFTLRMLSSTSARRKVIAAIVIYSLVSFALLPLGLVKNEFFPKSDAEILYLNLELPSGTTLDKTTTQTLELLDDLKHTPEVDYVVAEVGRSFDANGNSAGGGQNISLFSLHLPPKEERATSSIDIAQNLRDKYKDYAQGELSVVELSGGPPAGSDIQLTLLGDDLHIVDGYADQLVKYLETQPGVANVKKSITTGTSQIVFVPDQTKLAAAGVSADQIGLWLRIYASGFTLDSIDLNDESQDKVDVIFKLSQSKADSLGLSSINITNQTGQSYPLLSLGHLETRANPTRITREEGQRSLTISAANLPGFSATDQNTALQKQADALHMPDGYTWKTGGVNEENQKSVNSILQAMMLSAVLILVTMVVQFGSFRQAFIVLIVIPLAVSSVFLIFAITGTPLSFPALIGVLSLFGIVVTNSMFIVDKINLNKREGMRLKEAIADAGASRLEPIILTKLCTVLGLLPITIADPLWRGLGGAIISGLLLSSTIMLLFIPALYYSMFKNTEQD